MMGEDLKYKSGKIEPNVLLELYRQMLYARSIEERMLIALRQGKVSKWFSGIGQEAIAVGAAMALHADDLIFPLHRNLGVFTVRNVPLDRLVGQWQGKVTGFTRGRDRSFHFGSMQHHIVGMISHLGAQLPLAVGASLAEKLQASGKICLAFTGEGGTSEGDFHEALNLAAVWKLPVIFLVENNGYALSTPVEEQFVCKNIAKKAKGYGIKGVRVDGNNVLQVYSTISKWSEKIRSKSEPLLMECKTFRMRGHEEASGTKYVPQELLDHWSARDPISNYEAFLLEKGIVNKDFVEGLKEMFREEVSDIVSAALTVDAPRSSAEHELKDVFAPYQSKDTEYEDLREIRFVDAIREAIDQEMTNNDRLVLMGQDIGTYGGVFKVTEGLIEKYGAERVRNTPLCESAVIGAGMGLSLRGYSAMVEMQFADFVSCGFNQVVNNLAKTYYRWNHAVNVTLRLPCGGQLSAGPFHSQSMEAWFFHTPGLKIVYPSNALDAKGLLISCLRDPNPTLFFEHKYLYRSEKGMVPKATFEIPIGEAQLIEGGNQALIITYGLGVQWAKNLVRQEGYEISILDLRSLKPLDYKSIDDAVKKVGRVLILHEACLTGGVGGEIAAYIAEHLFEYLDAPVMRCASLDTPIPFAKSLEDLFLPYERLADTIKKLVNY